MTQADSFRIALGQFFVKESGAENLEIVKDLIARAEAGGADLLVLPEGIVARKPGDPSWGKFHSEPLDGPFVTGFAEATKGRHVTAVCTVQAKIPGEARYANDLLVAADGELKLVYQKLHLYDAFKGRESDSAVPGNEIPPVLQIGPMKAGFLTCYDVRFPEMTRALALAGAELLVVPAAWVKGPLKESHWDLNLRARALENTCYVAGVSECGPVNIGESKIVDPMGVVVAQCGTSDQLLFADIDPSFVGRCRQALPVLENRRFAAPRLRHPGEL